MSTMAQSYLTLRQQSTERQSKLITSNPASRTCSPTPNRRIAKLNSYLSRSAWTSSEPLCPPSESCLKPSRSLIKRWDGNQRTTVKWDSVRRDPELWFLSGDCLVHFYERGFSRRGASLRVSLADLESGNCGLLLDRFLIDPVSPSDLTPGSDIHCDVPGDFNDPSPATKYELYIPAPTYLTREEALQYHMETRNFFAWIYDKPLVGERLGEALISLLERMNEYRPNQEENQNDTLEYIDDQGYSDFRDCPDHALAVLQFSERFEICDLWTDAFVHCTGMNERLDSSAEFGTISRASHALITRAGIEMNLRLERAGKSLGNFLEDDLSGAYVGLGKEAQLHLERFRSFLHSFYVGHYTFWPPTAGGRAIDALPKSVYTSMYFDFRNLYEYLVDQSSGVSMQDNKPVDGGICVFQNLVAFDKRNKYAALPHPLPLVPKVPVSLGHRGMRKWNVFSNKQAKLEQRVLALAALTTATNCVEEQVMNNGLVQEYLRFEKAWTIREETTVSCADARKVRWILVYSILQTLISVTQIPNEVRDTEGVSYHLAVQVAGTPPWPPRKPGTTQVELQPSTPTSLHDQIIELGPDMDIVTAMPTPLTVNHNRGKSPSPPRRLSLGFILPLKAPQPLRAPSIEFLNNNYSNSNALDTSAAGPSRQQDVSPVAEDKHFAENSVISLPKPTTPIMHEDDTDPSTPSTSETGASGGWSASSSENEMEHASVNGSDSNYGDDEDEDEPSSIRKTLPTSKATRYSRESFGDCNPEVDQYVRS